MIKLTRGLFVAATASLMPLSMAVAPPASAAVMPLSSIWRACDGTKLAFVPAVGDARPTANLSSNGSGTVVTTVDVATALPDTRYDVRVIQVPRSPLGCAPGAPGVVTGSLQTNGVGAGSTTVSGPILSGATKAWVIVERPSGSSQTPAEFYSSEFAAAI